MKYPHYLLLGAALITGCTLLEEPEEKADTEVPNETGTVFVDAFESNDAATSATPISLGVPVKARIQTTTDLDFYSFSVPDSFAQGGYVKARLSPFPGMPEISYLNELKQDYGPRHYESTKGADLITWISVAEGKTYYTRVKDWSNRADSNPYTLSLEFVPVYDSFEPNNKWDEAAAIALDSTYKAFMFHHGSNEEADHFDHYKVTLADSGRIQVSLTHFPVEMAPEFTILTSGGQRIVNYYSTTHGSDLIEASNVMAPGEYIIQVVYWVGTPPLGGEGSELPEAGTKPYHFKVSALPKTGI